MLLFFFFPWEVMLTLKWSYTSKIDVLILGNKEGWRVHCCMLSLVSLYEDLWTVHIMVTASFNARTVACGRALHPLIIYLWPLEHTKEYALCLGIRDMRTVQWNSQIQSEAPVGWLFFFNQLHDTTHKTAVWNSHHDRIHVAHCNHQGACLNTSPGHKGKWTCQAVQSTLLRRTT